MTQPFSLASVLDGTLTEPHALMKLRDARYECWVAFESTENDTHRARLSSFVILINDLERKLSELPFPGGPVTVDRNFAERKLSEFLGPGRECHVTYHEREWHCRLYVGADYYSASSTIGMLDAIANALMAAQGREEIT